MTLGNPRCIAESENGKKTPKEWKIVHQDFCMLHQTSSSDCQWKGSRAKFNTVEDSHEGSEST